MSTSQVVLTFLVHLLLSSLFFQGYIVFLKELLHSFLTQALKIPSSRKPPYIRLMMLLLLMIICLTWKDKQKKDKYKIQKINKIWIPKHNLGHCAVIVFTLLIQPSDLWLKFDLSLLAGIKGDKNFQIYFGVDTR